MSTTHHRQSTEERVEEEVAHKVMVSMSEGRWKLLMWGFGLHFTLGTSFIMFLAGWVKGNSSDISTNRTNIAAAIEMIASVNNSVEAVNVSLKEHIAAQNDAINSVTSALKEDLGDITIALKELKLDVRSVDTSVHGIDKRVSVMEGNRFTSTDAVEGQRNTDKRLTSMETAVNTRIDNVIKQLEDLYSEIRMLHGSSSIK